MRQIGQPHEDAADERAGRLREHVPGHLRPWELANRRGRNRDGGVQVRPAHRVDGIDRDRDAARPAGGDDNPPAVLPLRSREDDVGDDAVAEEDEQRGAPDFRENRTHTDADRLSYFSVSFCTRQFIISATYKVLGSRQSISLTMPNSLNCLPALPKRPTTVPSSCIL